MNAKTLKFIQRAKLIHPDKYDYSKVNYKTNKTKVIITCPLHGDFTQSPESHLRLRGCPECGRASQSALRTKSKEQYIIDAKKKHGDFYDYSEVLYINNNTDIIIICSIHGKFKQNPNNHMRGKGCYNCYLEKSSMSQTKSIDQFKEEATATHKGKYDYSKSIYICNLQELIIICPSHGEFLQMPKVHLRGGGCKKCKDCGYSKLALTWLDKLSYITNMEIQHAGNKGEYVVTLQSGKQYKLDGAYVGESNKIAFEFNGSFWHGDPRKYDPDKINQINGKTFGNLYEITLNKKEKLEKLGWMVISIWESDFNDNIILYPEDCEKIFGTSDVEFIMFPY